MILMNWSIFTMTKVSILLVTTIFFIAESAHAGQWLTGNRTNDHNTRSGSVGCFGGKAIGLEVHEQGGYGVINFAPICDIDPTTRNFILANDNVEYKHIRKCPQGTYITAMKAQEQGGYGVIDIIMYCSSPSKPWIRHEIHFTGNRAGSTNPQKTCRNGHTANDFTAVEQFRHGIINIAIEC